MLAAAANDPGEVSAVIGGDPASFAGLMLVFAAFAIAWQRRPGAILDTSRGVEWARWWIGGAFNYAAAAIFAEAA